MTSRRVLIIEDKVDSAEALGCVMELSGHQVQIAYDGESGIEKARTFQPEVVLCDIGLPGEADGYAVARLLRGQDSFRDTFLVAVTGYAGRDDIERSHEAGFDLHMRKPVDAIALAKVIADRP